MKKQTKKYVRAIIVSGLIGFIHFFLHDVINLQFKTVGLWITGIIFFYLAYLEDKV